MRGYILIGRILVLVKVDLCIEGSRGGDDRVIGENEIFMLIFFGYFDIFFEL